MSQALCYTRDEVNVEGVGLFTDKTSMEVWYDFLTREEAEQARKGLFIIELEQETVYTGVLAIGRRIGLLKE